MNKFKLLLCRICLLIVALNILIYFIYHSDNKKTINQPIYKVNNNVIPNNYSQNNYLIPKVITITKSTNSTYNPIELNRFKLISDNKPVTSDVRGNLGPPNVITSEKVDDWLKDRWQAASDMSGRPIPGPHWLLIDLINDYYISKFLIDWEDAYSNDYIIQGKLNTNDQFIDIIKYSNKWKVHSYKKHIIHETIISNNTSTFRFIKLLIYSPSTRWGSSVWRFHIYGYD